MDHELFSEVYNRYFLVVRQILEAADKAPVTEKEMAAMAAEYGYEETVLFVVPKLLSGEWDLLTKRGRDDSSEENGFSSKVGTLKPLPLTKLQKSWIRTMMADPKFRLFFSNDACERLERVVGDAEPLFDWGDFLWFDRYLDRDPVESDMYRRHFQIILEAIHSRRVLEIEYYSAKDRFSSHRYLPYRIEYSPKTDKFRLLAVMVRKGRMVSETLILNISRIMRIRATALLMPEFFPGEADVEPSVCQEPVLLEISGERNGLERTMLHFACYRKQTEKLGDSGKYLCKIFYRREMETELLIQILSFGPVVKVLGPEPFLEQVRERVRRQKEWIDKGARTDRKQ